MPVTSIGDADATGAVFAAEAAGCESEAEVAPVTPIGDAGVTDEVFDVEAAGCESEVDAVPVTPIADADGAAATVDAAG